MVTSPNEKRSGKSGSCASGLRARSLRPQQALGPREQDGEIERFWEVVVGADLKPLQQVVRAAAGP